MLGGSFGFNPEADMRGRFLTQCNACPKLCTHNMVGVVLSSGKKPMRRREFLGVLGGAAAAWPVFARAQATPVVGYLSSRSPGDSAHIIAAFRKGLGEGGFIEGSNVAIESRFAESHLDRLPELAADLVRRQVNVVAATGGTSSVVATKPVVPLTMPLVFAMGGDPVKLGIVDSLARPGGNVTGIAFLVNGLTAKHLQLLLELAPKAMVVGFLVNPTDPNLASDTQQAQEAARALGHKLVIVNASAESDLEPAFTMLAGEKADALFVQVGPFTAEHRTKITALAARHALPAIYALREFVDAGGLMSYGTDITDANRQLGIYTGRVLKGTKPADLPVMQSTKFELVINLKAARALGLDIPTSILLHCMSPQVDPNHILTVDLRLPGRIQPAILQCVRDFRTAGRFRAAAILLSVGCVIGRTSRIYLASASQKLSA
jgi:putative ABC transport system substrate-binding protein